MNKEKILNRTRSYSFIILNQSSFKYKPQRFLLTNKIKDKSIDIFYKLVSHSMRAMRFLLMKRMLKANWHVKWMKKWNGKKIQCRLAAATTWNNYARKGNKWND